MSLCPTCQHVREITTAKGSRFWMCRYSETDPGYPKYPPQPVRQCAAFVPREGEAPAEPRALR
jgi:hypothetical protein